MCYIHIIQSLTAKLLSDISRNSKRSTGQIKAFKHFEPLFQILSHCSMKVILGKLKSTSEPTGAGQLK